MKNSPNPLRYAGRCAVATVAMLASTTNPRAIRWLAFSAVLALNCFPALAQGAGGFSSTDLKTGISNSLAVIMLFGFVLGIAAVIAGGFAIRCGDVDTGKLSIIGGAII